MSRQKVFVCSGIIENKLISQIFEGENDQEVEEYYKLKFKIKPEIILGPFTQKRERQKKIIFEPQIIKFSGKSVKANYNNWLVSALLLKDPEGCAFLLFDKRIDDKKMQKPLGTCIVRLDEIKIL